MKLRQMSLYFGLFLTVLILSACAGGATGEQSPAAAPLPAENTPAVAATEIQPAEKTGVTESAPVPAGEQAVNGQQLVETRCSACHSLDRIKSAKKSSEDWAKTVQRMVAKGAELNDSEQQAVIKYLGDTYK